MPQLEVLVGKLLAIDGLASRAIASGEVAALEHKVGDDAVELGALVAEALLAGAEGAEVLGRLGDDVVKELEVDAPGLLCTTLETWSALKGVSPGQPHLSPRLLW